VNKDEGSCDNIDPLRVPSSLLGRLSARTKDCSSPISGIAILVIIA
jgi:hypothetical protein